MRAAGVGGRESCWAGEELLCAPHAAGGRLRHAHPLTALGNAVLLLQGAATSVYAATAPELESHSGAYLADCAIKAPSKQAQDGELAKQLWAKTQELIEGAVKKRAGGEAAAAAQ